MISDLDLADSMSRLLPHVMIAPVDPTLLSAYVAHDQKAALLSAGHMNPSFESLCSRVEPSPLSSTASASPSPSCLLGSLSPLPLSEGEVGCSSPGLEGASSPLYTDGSSSPFQTTSSRLKYLKRWSTCFERTLIILDTLIAHRPKASVYGNMWHSVARPFICACFIYLDMNRTRSSLPPSRPSSFAMLTCFQTNSSCLGSLPL